MLTICVYVNIASDRLTVADGLDKMVPWRQSQRVIERKYNTNIANSHIKKVIKSSDDKRRRIRGPFSPWTVMSPRQESVLMDACWKKPISASSENAAVSLRRQDLSMWVKPVVVYSSSYMVPPPSHRRLSVWESIQQNQRLTHCVLTRPANKDNLSALSTFPISLLLFAATFTVFQNHWQRRLCTALPYISISAITWWSRVTLAFTFVPGADRHHPFSQVCKLAHTIVNST